MSSTGENRQLKDGGFVSIVVTLIITLILSLIVLGFAQLARREQRQALDRQLGQQALYAAESGVNDVRKLISAGTLISDITDCNSASLPNRNLDSTVGNVAYTCVLAKQGLPTLEYGNIDTEKSTVFPITSTSGNFQSLTFGWHKDGGSNTFPSPTNDFVTKNAWDAGTYGAGVLRIDLIPANLTNRTDIINKTFTVFAYPTNSGATVSVAYSSGTANQGSVVPVKCDGAKLPKKCSLQIDIPTSDQTNRYFARVKSIYTTSALTVSGAVGGGPATFSGTQVEVDSTGKANDVLKRIRVRIPVTSTTNDYPEFALDSGDKICKKLSVIPSEAKLNGCDVPS
jgi:Tfp pilus assembly protein PilX